MARTAKKAEANGKGNDAGAPLGFAAKLWLAADTLGNNRDMAECTHAALVFTLFTYITAAFSELPAKVPTGSGTALRCTSGLGA